ncbi:MAG: hypothetical protein QG674_124 [Patescibacteria group bacterium]|nr:hypothetical protein [Patescibacteria group bacterium]
MVDIEDLKSSDSNVVRVRVSPRAQSVKEKVTCVTFSSFVGHSYVCKTGEAGSRVLSPRNPELAEG